MERPDSRRRRLRHLRPSPGYVAAHRTPSGIGSLRRMDADPSDIRRRYCVAKTAPGSQRWMANATLAAQSARTRHISRAMNSYSCRICCAAQTYRGLVVNGCEQVQYKTAQNPWWWTTCARPHRCDAILMDRRQSGH